MKLFLTNIFRVQCLKQKTILTNRGEINLDLFLLQTVSFISEQKRGVFSAHSHKNKHCFLVKVRPKSNALQSVFFIICKKRSCSVQFFSQLTFITPGENSTIFFLPTDFFYPLQQDCIWQVFKARMFSYAIIEQSCFHPAK